eukprot:7579544-Alexandrium_andersonii.AAC.1
MHRGLPRHPGRLGRRESGDPGPPREPEEHVGSARAVAGAVRRPSAGRQRADFAFGRAHALAGELGVPPQRLGRRAERRCPAPAAEGERGGRPGR